MTIDELLNQPIWHSTSNHPRHRSRSMAKDLHDLLFGLAGRRNYPLIVKSQAIADLLTGYSIVHGISLIIRTRDLHGSDKQRRYYLDDYHDYM